MFRSILNQVRKPLELSTLASGFCTRSPILRRIRGNKKISHSKKNVTVCESIFKKLGWIKKKSCIRLVSIVISIHRKFFQFHSFYITIITFFSFDLFLPSLRLCSKSEINEWNILIHSQKSMMWKLLERWLATHSHCSREPKRLPSEQETHQPDSKWIHWLFFLPFIQRTLKMVFLPGQNSNLVKYIFCRLLQLKSQCAPEHWGKLRKRTTSLYLR